MGNHPAFMGGMHVLAMEKRYSQAEEPVRRRVGTGLVEGRRADGVA
jgi:hypothetical protein